MLAYHPSYGNFLCVSPHKPELLSKLKTADDHKPTINIIVHKDIFLGPGIPIEFIATGKGLGLSVGSVLGEGVDTKLWQRSAGSWGCECEQRGEKGCLLVCRLVLQLKEKGQRRLKWFWCLGCQWAV